MITFSIVILTIIFIGITIGAYELIKFLIKEYTSSEKLYIIAPISFYLSLVTLIVHLTILWGSKLV